MQRKYVSDLRNDYVRPLDDSDAEKIADYEDNFCELEGTPENSPLNKSYFLVLLTLFDR